MARHATGWQAGYSTEQTHPRTLIITVVSRAHSPIIYQQSGVHRCRNILCIFSNIAACVIICIYIILDIYNIRFYLSTTILIWDSSLSDISAVCVKCQKLREVSLSVKTNATVKRERESHSLAPTEGLRVYWLEHIDISADCHSQLIQPYVQLMHSSVRTHMQLNPNKPVFGAICSVNMAIYKSTFVIV